ncbi:hypothetical protein [Micavibrio aeruginosavorus]|uniref:Motility protein n=1 Tax=Micavibrio aeruginosavorus (strain ARL-13) TaxID=856793 RepID=G2KQI6_MICAA|nr:hypothetical protein [Micavibrio aeruginosavorus]AEP09122.1 hypothetical protein MICA_788 [Micavibrio aeruginosavorus ARL-13]
MTELPAMIAANMAMTQQAIAMEMIKQAADMQQQMVQMLQESVASVPVSTSRGTTVNIAA